MNRRYRSCPENTRSNEIPAHNTFHTLRQRIGPEGFSRIHRHFVFQAYETGLLTPPLKHIPEILKDKIILIGDSTFLLAVASTKGEKDTNGNWLFTDESIAFGKPHHKHKYPVGHRAHSVMCVSGIPMVSLLAPANESDEGTPLCLFGYMTRRKGIEYNHQRTKFACYHACKKDPQQLLFNCPYRNPQNRFGWMTHTRFKDSYRTQGPAVPGSRVYERLKPLRTGIERYYGLAKENRYRMETNNTYMGHDNVLIHVIEHDITLTLDIIFQHNQTGKWSDILKV